MGVFAELRLGQLNGVTEGAQRTAELASLCRDSLGLASHTGPLSGAPRVAVHVNVAVDDVVAATSLSRDGTRAGSMVHDARRG